MMRQRTWQPRGPWQIPGGKGPGEMGNRRKGERERIEDKGPRSSSLIVACRHLRYGRAFFVS